MPRFCEACGTSVSTSAGYCGGCGRNLSEAVLQNPVAPSNLPPSAPSFTRSLSRWVRGAFSAVAAIVVIFLALSYFSTRRTHRQNLMPPELVVKAGTIYYVNFQVGNGGATVIGRFQATGGSGNDIQVVVADADNFENWRNGQPARVLYSTDRTTVGTINVRVSQPGNYYLGFNNQFSLITDKTITSNVTLEY
jgi:hypothetical protein